jgi:hypothetical protein
MRKSSAILVSVRIFIWILMENPLQIVHKGSLISLMYTIHSVPYTADLVYSIIRALEKSF